MAPLTGKLAPVLGSTPEAHPALRAIQSRKPFVMPGVWPEHIPRYEICCLQNLTKSSRNCAFFFVVGSARCNNLSFTLTIMFGMSRSTMPLKCYGYDRPLGNYRINILVSGVHMSYQDLQSVQLLISQPNQHNFISVRSI